jgi:arabinofuranosyltransferase
MVVNQLESASIGRAERRSSSARAQSDCTILVPLFLLAAIFISLVISMHFLPAATDDALISYRYSDRLLHGKGLTWNDREFVEGYSNLLWVLLVALGGLLQSNLVLVGWVLGAIANTATLCAIAWTFGRAPNPSITAVLGGLFLVAGSECFAYWAVGGMETALLCALVSWALALACRTPSDRYRAAEFYASLLFGFLAITRPDGLLFGVSAGIGELIRNGFTRNAIRRSMSFAAVPLVFMGLQVAFRLAYYGSPIPNTSFAKLSFTFERISEGGSYVAEGAMVNGAILATTVVTIVVLWRSTRWQVFRQSAVFIVPGTVWLAYICVVGGDWFPFERQWQPALICFAFAASSLLSQLPTMRPRPLASLVVAVGILHIAAQATINPYLLHFRRDSEFMETLQSELKAADPSGRAEREFLADAPESREDSLKGDRSSYQQCVAIGRLLHTAFSAEQPLIAVNPAGCLPYYSKLPAIDMLGLSDSHIAHHPPPDMGSGPLGHELGDGIYVLSRKPDLIVFCAWGEAFGVVVPCYRGDRQIAKSPDLSRYYRLIRYRAGEFEMQGWTRIEDGRIGIRRTADRIYIPGFLLATTSGARGVLDSTGKLVAKLQYGDARIEDIELPLGTWELSLETDGPSPLQFTTLPSSEVTTLSPRRLRILSAGGPRSFRVFGAQGLIYAIIARRVQGGSGEVHLTTQTSK